MFSIVMNEVVEKELNLLIPIIDSEHLISASTLKQYVSCYKRMAKLYENDKYFEINGFLGMTQKVFIDFLRNLDIPPESKSNMISTLLYLKKMDKIVSPNHSGPGSAEIIKYRDNVLKKEIKEWKIKKNEKYIKDPTLLPSHLNILKYVKELENQPYFRIPTLMTKIATKHYHFQTWRKYLINYMLVHYGLRNKDLNFIIKPDEGYRFKKSRYMDDIYNYLIVKKNAVWVIIQDYKTKATYGPKVWNITDRRFCKYMYNLINNEKFSEEIKEEGFITLLPTSVYENEDLTNQYIQKHTINKIGQGNIFKIIFTTAYKDGDLDRIIELSKYRGTKVETCFTNYNLEVPNLLTK